MRWGLTRRNETPVNNNLDSLRRDIDRVFDDFFSFSPANLYDSEWMPRLDVDDDGEKIMVTAEIPGMDEKNLDVSIENNVLTIAGEKEEERKEEDKKGKPIVSERRFGSFKRTVSLPQGIKADDVKAKFKNGVLSLEIPRDESQKPKKIDVKLS